MGGQADGRVDAGGCGETRVADCPVVYTVPPGGTCNCLRQLLFFLRQVAIVFDE